MIATRPPTTEVATMTVCCAVRLLLEFVELLMIVTVRALLSKMGQAGHRDTPVKGQEVDVLLLHT